MHRLTSFNTTSQAHDAIITKRSYPRSTTCSTSGYTSLRSAVYFFYYTSCSVPRSHPARTQHGVTTKAKTKACTPPRYLYVVARHLQSIRDWAVPTTGGLYLILPVSRQPCFRFTSRFLLRLFAAGFGLGGPGAKVLMSISRCFWYIMDAIHIHQRTPREFVCEISHSVSIKWSLCLDMQTEKIGAANTPYWANALVQ